MSQYVTRAHEIFLTSLTMVINYFLFVPFNLKKVYTS